MDFYHLAHEAQLHREAYIAVLNGLLTSPAAKRHFAQTIGITPQYLSYLLNPYGRVPSPELAHKIVAVLPLDAAAKPLLLEHLLLASEHRLAADRRGKGISRAELASHLQLVQRAYAIAGFVTDTQEIRRQQATVYEVGTLLLQQLSPVTDPLTYAQLCLWLHEIECARNLHGAAIYHAKKARALLAAFDRTDFDADERARYDELTFTALRLEAVAYSNLHGYRSAYELCCVGEELPEMQSMAQAWLPHLYRDKINAYSKLSRFSIRRIEQWTYQGKLLCAVLDHDQAPLISLMLERSLARAYLRCGNIKKALALLQRLTDEVTTLPVVGLLHQIIVFKTYAQALAMDGDQTQWQAVVDSMLQQALQAGLSHQVAELERHRDTVLGQEKDRVK